MISKEEATGFLEEVLQLPSNWRAIVRTDKLRFLRLYMKHHATRIPFQNVTMAAVDIQNRCHPDESIIITQGLSGKGGCCINLNYFTKMVLNSIGLEAHAIQGTHFSSPVAGTHCMIVVQTSDEELYLIEVGGAFPLLEPIPMHMLPFRILAAGGFPYEFRKISDGIIGRFQIGGGLFGGEYIGKPEALRTSWDLTPRKFSEFDFAMKEMFTNPENSVLLRNPMMSRFFFPNEYKKLFLEPESCSEESIIYSTSENTEETPSDFVFVFKRVIIIGDALSRKFVRHYDSYDAMIMDVKNYFPQLDKSEIVKAFKIFDCHEVVSTPYDFIL